MADFHNKIDSSTLGKTSGGNHKNAAIRSNRYSPNYITGLGDGNANQHIRNVQPREKYLGVFSPEDDKQYGSTSQFLRAQQQQHQQQNRGPSRNNLSWSARLLGKLHYHSGGSSNRHSEQQQPYFGGDDFYNYKPGQGAAEAAAAPWQLSAFVLLGAVVLLSALFLHVLADSTENYLRQSRKDKMEGYRRPSRKDKMEDPEDGNIYEKMMRCAGDFSEPHWSEPSQGGGMVGGDASDHQPLYYPYQLAPGVKRRSPRSQISSHPNMQRSSPPPPKTKTPKPPQLAYKTTETTTAETETATAMATFSNRDSKHKRPPLHSTPALNATPTILSGTASSFGSLCEVFDIPPISATSLEVSSFLLQVAMGCSGEDFSEPFFDHIGPPVPVPLDNLDPETGTVTWRPTPVPDNHTIETGEKHTSDAQVKQALSPSIYDIIQINPQDILSHGSVSDGRPKPDHVRNNLLEDSNAAASLQHVIDFNELQLAEDIGGGGFGQVKKALWRLTPVAVKVLSGSVQLQKAPRSVLEEFAAEINLLSGMRHTNICLYMGACLQPPNRAIVTELAANGSLWVALRKPLKPPFKAVGTDGISDEEAWPAMLYQTDPRHGVPPASVHSPSVLQAPNASRSSLMIPTESWPWALVKQVACGTARGMLYLHSGVPPVLHRDLKSANILLNESYVPKLCDFGLSRLKAATGCMTGNCGTVQWMAPEVLAPDGFGNYKYNEKADVFSYGIVLWELLTKKRPYDGMEASQCAIAVLYQDHRPSIPTWCPPFLHTLICSCLKTNPHERPTFAQILVTLESME